MDISSLFDAVVAFFQERPLVLFCIIWIIFKMFQNTKPIPSYPGKVTAVKSAEQWKEVKESCKADNKMLLCDFYADWCGPCRAMAPRYAEMSKQWDAKNVTFAKVNASNLKVEKVRCFPTLILYKADGSKLEAFEGFNQTNVEAALEKYGAKRVAGDTKKDK
eukprot:CAMPEP_0170168482 /NCGR_PEP_ID=MMETSP0040_2-20121228/1508_1 /TAXON_ID=641309 /ORGANISM="Lotharella oceanica, Strain CCMP622" /LENGTH=161 /DNA_ID=CAMNT_0010406743 /DNA_START=32 /DNA_END=517 /DNA_ORIENTATION=+